MSSHRWFDPPILLAAVVFAWPAAAQTRSPLDRYLEEAQRAATRATGPSSGSLYLPEGPLAELGRDLRARQVNDMVTILVVEQANALSRGATSSSRKSSASGGISSLFGRGYGRLGSLGELSGSRELEGGATTSRQSTISARLSARVTDVLPNGYLVVEGNKEVLINSERQMLLVRGVARPADLSRDNSVRSDRLAEMEIRVSGKGLVNDAIRRPNFLYRLLLGLLPF